ncbi:MAG TPA: adenylyl-sulfate kinase [Solirubrobacteraceae bacterium]|nr:adenylyl-sulfate kinase [Solirubrobacteraceae bacterium]
MEPIKTTRPAGGTATNGSAQPFLSASTDLLRFATAGSVDDGKSTLIGRLLYDTKQILQDQLDHVEETSRRRGDGYLNLALLTDGLRAEREQGITIDVAYRYFATPRRRFIIADTPGHVRYTRNMVTGASTADLSVVLVDARKGVLEQSKRHAFISALLGVPHLVVCVNKMDLVGWDQAVFQRIVDEFTAFSSKFDVHDMTFIPVSALHGDNVVDRSESMPWYEGPPLLYHLEHVHVASDRNLVDARFPVQWVIRPMTAEHHDYRGYAGRMASGTLRPGEEVVVLPSGARTRIAAIESPEGPVDEAVPPMSVVVHLDGDLDVSRGDMICRPNNRPIRARSLEALICWMHEQPLREGASLRLKHTTRWTGTRIEEIRYRIDVNTLHRDDRAKTLELNDIGRVRLETQSPLLVDDYRRNRETGSFVLVDDATNATVAGGMIVETLTGEAPPVALDARSANVTWQESAVVREDRWQRLGHRGGTIWLTGLSGAGKSTLGAAIEKLAIDEGRAAYLLDGDNLRHGLNGNLGFEPGDRAENVRRTAHVAQLFADSGALAIVSLVSPYVRDRLAARRLHDEAGLDFIEVFVNTPLAVCEARDPKGLYARARRGEISGFTGIDDPYEPSPSAEIELLDEPLERAVQRVADFLAGRGLI